MKRLYFLILIVLVNISIYANITSVNFDNLPSDKTFKLQFSSFLDYSKYVSSYTYEWNYPVKKDTVINDITHFEKTLAKYNTQCSNTDLALLHIICLRYMYNLDIPDAGKKATTLIDLCTKKYPSDYRFHWVNGNFLCSKLKIQDGICEFIDVLKKSEEHNIIPPFLEDFAYNCVYGNMCFNGLYALKIASSMRNIDPSNYPIHARLQEQIIKLDINSKYERDRIWLLAKNRKQNYYLLSTAFGASIPIDQTCQFNYSGYDVKSSSVLIKPARIKSKNDKEIGVSIIINLTVNYGDYEQYVNTFIKNYNIDRSEEIKIRNNTFKLYYVSDNSEYQHMGGAKGILAFTNVNKSDYSNISIEIPMDLPKNDNVHGSTAYYRPAKVFDRIDKPLTISLALDSCNAVYSESETIYKKLLEECIFE